MPSMPSLPQIALMIACSICSSIVLFIVVKSVYDTVDIRSFLLAVVLMTLANAIDYFNLNPVLQWIIVAAVDWIILKKTIDCSVYFGFVAMAVWLGMQILFYEYLSTPILSALTGGGG